MRRIVVPVILLALLAIAALLAGPGSRDWMLSYLRPAPPGAAQDHEIARLTADITRHPSPEAYYRRGMAYKEREEYPMAVADFTQAIHRKPLAPEYWAQRANTEKRQGQYDVAIKDYDRALALQPMDGQVWFNKAQACFRAGREKEGTEAFQRFRALEPGEMLTKYLWRD